jgi:hypothetical protein
MNCATKTATYGLSYYSTDLSFGAVAATPSAAAYNGTNLIVAGAGGGTQNLSYSADFGKSWNSTNVSGGAMSLYGAAHNGRFFVVGGVGEGGAAPLLYGKTELGLTTWYPGIQSEQIFTTVWGVASNSGYGYNVVQNSLFLDVGDKISFITPKAYPAGAGDTEIAVNLTNYPVTF